MHGWMNLMDRATFLESGVGKEVAVDFALFQGCEISAFFNSSPDFNFRFFLKGDEKSVIFRFSIYL